MKKGRMTLLLFLGIIFAFYLVKASYNEGNPALVVNNVGPSQLVGGYLNFSFENESSDYTITAKIRENFNTKNQTNIKLFDFMKNAEALGVDFDCWYNQQKIEPCSLVFDEEASSTTYNGNAGENYVGFVLNGNDVNVESLNFEIGGQNPQNPMCGSVPLSIDLFADGSIDYQYVKPALGSGNSVLCGYKQPPGFTYTTDSLLLADWIYCENISLDNIAGKVRLGGWIKLVNSSYVTSDGDIFFKIKTPMGVEKICNTTTSNQNYARVYCDVNVFVGPGNYTICARASDEAESSTAFQIQYGGGHFGLFAAEFKNQPFVGSVNFNETTYNEQTGRDLIGDINSFLNEKYGGNCSNNCIIPFLINSTQPFSLSNLNLEYSNGPIPFILTRFTSLGIAYPEIDTKGYVQIPLEAFNLTAPNEPGVYNFKVSYRSFIEDSNFEVENVPVISSFSPQQAMINEPTQFIVTAYSPKGNNITTYTVYWGDGSSDSNNNGIFTHTYTSVADYNVEIHVTDSENLTGVAYFPIHVGVTFSALNLSINGALTKINNFETSLAGEFYANWLGQQLNLQQVKQELTNLSSRLLVFGPQANESQLAEIKQQFDSLKPRIPISLESFATYNSFSYAVDQTKINIANVQSATNDSCPYDEDNCKRSLGVWNYNLSLTISGEKKKIKFHDGSERIITIFNITSSRMGGKLIIELSPTSIYSISNFYDLGNAVAFDLQPMSFVYAGDIEPYSIVMYAAPQDLDQLPEVGNVNGKPQLYEKKQNNLPKILMILAAILFVAGIVIIWLPYLNKYLQNKALEKERKLFPSRTDYYNLYNFVANALVSGHSENDLMQKLLAAGWKKEQINYVFKKVKKIIKEKK